jgi:hypothetical protein
VGITKLCPSLSFALSSFLLQQFLSPLLLVILSLLFFFLDVSLPLSSLAVAADYSEAQFLRGNPQRERKPLIA